MSFDSCSDKFGTLEGQEQANLAPKPINTPSEWALRISSTFSQYWAVLGLQSVQTGHSLLQNLLCGPLIAKVDQNQVTILS